MKMTTKIPTKPGYYWWSDRGEHTPCILCVEKSGKKLYASNEEYGFFVKKESDSLWSEQSIPLPIIDGEVVEPSSF
jgi:hypothetical protein